MIISHKYKFIFIKTLKTAGTSLEVYLSSICGEKDIFTPIFPKIKEHQSRNFRPFFNPFREFKCFNYNPRKTIRTLKEFITLKT